MVTNAGTRSQNQVVVAVKISEEMKLVDIPTSPVGGHQHFPRSVRFKPVAEIRPGESITFELQVEADGPAPAPCKSTSPAAGLPQPVSTTETTQILD